MFSGVRRRLSYANVVVTFALVFAMSGGAYAASKFLITSTKQIKPSVLKQLQGKAGVAGPVGPAGPTGPGGPGGAAGPAGKDGVNGVAGANGVSVTSTAVAATKETCGKQGGVELTAAENKKTTLCNGKEGSPWTAGGTLPSGKTETGAWSTESNAGKVIGFTVTFAIPLSAPIAAANVHMVTVAEVEGNSIPSGCGGTAEEPKAAPGDLCVFEGSSGALLGSLGSFIVRSGALFGSAAGAGTTGAFYHGRAEEEESMYWGTFAVTAL